MASAAPSRELPAYPLGDLPSRCRHVVLAPAVRWRSVVDLTQSVDSDVMLEAVARLRQCGETSSSRIADLLQLPQDLVDHLLARVALERLLVSDEGELSAAQTSVAWVYRDATTGELWPTLGHEVTPVSMHWISPQRAYFEIGTAGRPITVHGLLLPAEEISASEPTSRELARHTPRRRGRYHRAAIVSSGEPCWVVGPVIDKGSGYSIETPEGVLFLSLTRALRQLAEGDVSTARWLATMPASASTSHQTLPVEEAVDELDAVLRRRGSDVEILDSVELCLSRLADQIAYDAKVDPYDADQQEGIAVILRDRGFAADHVHTLVTAGPGSLGDRVAGVLVSMPDATVTHSRCAELVLASHQWHLLYEHRLAGTTAGDLAQRTIDLCHGRQHSQEQDHGK